MPDRTRPDRTGPDDITRYLDEWREWAHLCDAVLAANRIQQAWRRCRDDPSYLVCRKRLMREFKQLRNEL